MLGFGMAWACMNLVHIVITVSSYLQLPCFVQTRLFPCSHLLSLALTLVPTSFYCQWSQSPWRGGGSMQYCMFLLSLNYLYSLIICALANVLVLALIIVYFKQKNLSLWLRGTLINGKRISLGVVSIVYRFSRITVDLLLGLSPANP